MENNSFSSTIPVGGSAEETIRKIGRVAEWWGVSISGNSAKQGDHFSGKMSADAFVNFTVEELVPGKRLVWLVTDSYFPWYGDKTEWTGTRLVFVVQEGGGEMKLSFTHEGLTPDVECYNDCHEGWTHWIKTSLFSFLTTGKGVFRQPTKQ